MDLYDFFYNELKTLKARTGYSQWEKLNEAKNPESEINALIGFMMDECNKPPFDLVKDKTILQRVISKAVVEDSEFIGLNAKFIWKSLHKWWADNGQRVIERRDEKPESVYQKVALTPEADARVNTLLKSFQRSIENGVFQQVPDIETTAEQEGKEWKSEIERKAVSKGHPKAGLEVLQEHANRVIKGRRLHYLSKYPNATEEDIDIYLNSFNDML